MFLVALIVSSFLDVISKQARRNAAVSVLLLKKNDFFYPIFQPRGWRSSAEFILSFRSPVGRYQHFVD